MRTQTMLAVAPHADVAFVRGETPVDAVDMQQVISDLYFESPPALDVRRLWSEGPITYFRVNWWRRARVRQSAFLAVELRPGGWRVYDCTRRAA